MSVLFESNLKIKVTIPKALKPWFESKTPITYKLEALIGSAELTLLSQYWIAPQWWDRWVLQINEPVFQREILMKSNNKVYWYARSVIPLTCYQAAPDFFNRLSKESIRNLIFDEPRVQLHTRTVYPINKKCIEYYWVSKHVPTLSDMLWVRATEYSFCNKHSFYLIELIFPELEQVS